MHLNIIIPTYNDLPGVLRCLTTLRATAHADLDCLIYDDASPLHDFRALISPDLARVERSPVNRGFGTTCNAAAQLTTGELLVFVNQDIYADPRHSAAWDMHLRRVFANDPTVGIVAPRLLHPDGSIQSVGGVFDARCQPVHRCLGWTGLTHPEVATRREVAWVTGAMFAIRRDLFAQIGGFDPLYAPSYFEDVDACLKVRDLGYKIIVEPAATLFHRVGSTGGSPHFRRSAFRFKEKWVNSGRITPDYPATLARYW